MKKVLILIFALAMSSFACGQAPPSPLRIGPGDLISIDVFDVPELKQEIRVSDSGEAKVALLGSLPIAGMTVDEAEHFLEKNLNDRHLVIHPQVALLIREYATQGVSITGEVHKPGIYTLNGLHTLLQVIAQAGGLTQIASPKIDIRHADGQHETALLDTEGPAADVALRPGDTIVVPRMGIAYIVGDVSRAGGYVMQDRGDLTVAKLVALGGGLLPTARGAKGKLVRTSGNTREEIQINVNKILRGRTPDIHLCANDILFIPNSVWKTTATRLQNITQMTAGAAIYTSLN